MDKARALLIKGDMTVAEVAEAVGFESANYFSRCSASIAVARQASLPRAPDVERRVNLKQEKK